MRFYVILIFNHFIVVVFILSFVCLFIGALGHAYYVILRPLNFKISSTFRQQPARHRLGSDLELLADAGRVLCLVELGLVVVDVGDVDHHLGGGVARGRAAVTGHRLQHVLSAPLPVHRPQQDDLARVTADRGVRSGHPWYRREKVTHV